MAIYLGLLTYASVVLAPWCVRVQHVRRVVCANIVGRGAFGLDQSLQDLDVNGCISVFSGCIRPNFLTTNLELARDRIASQIGRDADPTADHYIGDMFVDEDQANAVIAKSSKEYIQNYNDFYEEMDVRVINDTSMNLLFFGPPEMFFRLTPETILRLLMATNKRGIPVNRAIYAWDIITDGSNARFVQYRELVAFGELLNTIPEEDLFYLNMADEHIVSYFANSVDIQHRKLGIIAASYRRYNGDDWKTNASVINSVEALLCGFPPLELSQILPALMLDLTQDFFMSIDKCNAEQALVLFNLVTHTDAFGRPPNWNSHDIAKLGLLFYFISPDEISALSLDAMGGISEAMMSSLDQRKLLYFSRQHVRHMQLRTRRKFMFRLKLLNAITLDAMKSRAAADRFDLNFEFVLMFFYLVYLNILRRLQTNF